jgi:hypothetical protein
MKPTDPAALLTSAQLGAVRAAVAAFVRRHPVWTGISGELHARRIERGDADGERAMRLALAGAVALRSLDSAQDKPFDPAQGKRGSADG